MKMEDVVKMMFEGQPPSQMPMPHPVEMAKSLVNDGIKWVMGGMKLSPKEVSEKRLSICNECEFYSGARCSKCGCQMRVKTTLATSSCPIGKWDAIREIGKFVQVSEKPASTQTETNQPAS